MNGTSLFMILALLSSTGCSQLQVEHTHSTAPLGSSVNAMVESQKLNPLAGGTQPVVGSDGVYTSQVVKNYHKGPKDKLNEGESLLKVMLGGK